MTRNDDRNEENSRTLAMMIVCRKIDYMKVKQRVIYEAHYKKKRYRVSPGWKLILPSGE